MQGDKSTQRWIAALLVGFPLGLIGFSLIAWWRWQSSGEEVVSDPRFTLPIVQEDLATDLEKIRNFATPRYVGNPAAERGLSRMSSMIQGTLGLSNAGYRLDILPGLGGIDGNWPIITARLGPKEGSVLWVITGYDQPEAGGNDTSVAAVLAVAAAMNNDLPTKAVRFCFLPHANQAGPRRAEISERLLKQVSTGDELLWISDLSGNGLVLESRSPDPPLLEWSMGRPGLRVTAESGMLPEGFTYGIKGEGSTDGAPLERHTSATMTVAEVVRFLSK